MGVQAVHELQNESPTDSSLWGFCMRLPLAKNLWIVKMTLNFRRQYYVMKPMFNAYVDGFNLYKGVLEKLPEYKWLSIRTFCQAILPDSTLMNVYYFTAPVKARFEGDGVSDRQHAYLRVLEHSGVTIVRGKFRKDEKWTRVISRHRKGFSEPNLPVHLGFTQLAISRIFKRALPDLPMAKVLKMEEKGSDVNLASYLLRDAFMKNAKTALVITGDSDLATPIRFAGNTGMQITVLVPGSGQDVVELREAAFEVNRINLALLGEHQFPDIFFTASGRQIRRPREWRVSESTKGPTFRLSPKLEDETSSGVVKD